LPTPGSPNEQAHERWSADRQKVVDENKALSAKARAAHAEEEELARVSYNAMKARVEFDNARALEEARSAHAAALEAAAEELAAKRALFHELAATHCHNTAENAKRRADAKAAHIERQAALALANEASVLKARADHRAACENMKSTAQATYLQQQRDYEDLKVAIATANEEALAAARHRRVPPPASPAAAPGEIAAAALRDAQCARSAPLRARAPSAACRRRACSLC